MRFHFAPLSSTLSDLDLGHTGFQWPISRNLQDNHRVTIGDG